MCFASAGIPVAVIENEQDALQRGLERVRDNYQRSVKSGRLSTENVDQALSLISSGTDLSLASDADLVIEAVFEEMPIKKEVFAELDRHCGPTLVWSIGRSRVVQTGSARSTSASREMCTHTIRFSDWQSSSGSISWPSHSSPPRPIYSGCAPSSMPRAATSPSSGKRSSTPRRCPSARCRSMRRSPAFGGWRTSPPKSCSR